MIQVARGTQDILPDKINKWQLIEHKIRTLCKIYQYQEIRTPIFENTELFLRGVGESTDIVQKEMYTFSDRSDRSITLRPEGTASVVRSFIEHKMYSSPCKPTKLFYIAPIFRYERPGAGRYRQHHQFGIEALGSNDPALDAEVISMAFHFLQGLHLPNFKIVINSLGDNLSRVTYRQAIVDYFSAYVNDLCSDCKRRLKINPLRILDCKIDARKSFVQEAPLIFTYLNADSTQYFMNVQNYLTAMGIKFTIDPKLVRGLDYYNHTVFEIVLDDERFDANISLCGGGRYDALVAQLGGPETASIGFGMGIERLLWALELNDITLEQEHSLDCYLVSFGTEAQERTVVLLNELRQSGISAERDYAQRKAKAQLKMADRNNAEYVVIIGTDELQKGVVTLKNMQTRQQLQIKQEDLVNFLLKKKGNLNN